MQLGSIFGQACTAPSGKANCAFDHRNGCRFWPGCLRFGRVDFRRKPFSFQLGFANVLACGRRQSDQDHELRSLCSSPFLDAGVDASPH